MHAVTNRLRRTNEMVAYSEQGLLVKRYRNAPPAVVGQVACGLRDIRALQAKYRWATEKRKVERMTETGFPLPFEYHCFYTEGQRTLVIVEYKPGFITAEDKLRQGITVEEAYKLIGKCVGTLLNFHRASEGRMTHGDPYLENFDSETTLLFDFEHDYPCNGKDAMVRDQLIFFWHAVNVLMETGYLKTKQDFERLIDVVHTGYPGLETSIERLGILERLYFRLRFIDGEIK